MSDIFTPQLFGGLQQPAMPAVEPVAPPMPEMAAPMPAPAPAPQVIQQPVFIPVPIVPPKAPPKPKGLQISPEAIKRAQGIYPQEAAEKQSMIENAKAPPTPTGAWGAPA